MKPSSPSPQIIHVVNIKSMERWSIYHRLQELEIPCQCSTNQPLSVKLNNPKAIAQLCFVVKQSTAPRSELIDWLNHCWKIRSRQKQGRD